MKKIINVIGNDYDVFEDLERNQFIINGYFSNKNKLNGYKYLGSDKHINKFEHKTILSTDDPDFREFIYKKYKKKLLTFISKFSYVAKNAKIGLGSIILSNSLISKNCIIGNCCKIQIKSVMHHRSKLGNFSILAPNVTILGSSKIGQKVYIGSSSTIKNDLKIKKGFIIGMGSVVTKSLIKGKLAYGQNAKIIE